MLMYYSGPLLLALGILANDCHKPASRYPAITSYLAGMILPSPLHPSSNDALLGLLADYYRIQANSLSSYLISLLWNSPSSYLILSTIPLSSYQMNYLTLILFQFGCYGTAPYLIFYILSLFGLCDNVWQVLGITPHC